MQNNPKIDILWNTEALEAQGEELLTHLKVKNNKTQEESSTLEAGGLFYAIGHTPNTDFRWSLEYG